MRNPHQRDLTVLILTPPFCGFRLDAGRTVRQEDRRLDLVSMLSAGPRAALPAHVTRLEQGRDFHFRRMHGGTFACIADTVCSYVKPPETIGLVGKPSVHLDTHGFVRAP